MPFGQSPSTRYQTRPEYLQNIGWQGGYNPVDPNAGVNPFMQGVGINALTQRLRFEEPLLDVGSQRYYDRLNDILQREGPEKAQAYLAQVPYNQTLVRPETIPGSVVPILNTSIQTEGLRPSAPGTYQFRRPTHGDLGPTVAALQQELEGFGRGGTQQEQQWLWQDFYRTLVGSSLGLGKYGGQALDPLAQLQQQLQEQYDPSFISSFTGEKPFGELIGQRNQALRQQLEQRAAGMGVQGAYSGLLGQQERARNALAARAQAAYNPIALQTQQQLQQDTDALLNAINQAELEAERVFATSGV